MFSGTNRTCTQAQRTSVSDPERARLRLRLRLRVSALGHKRKWCHARVMSVLPSKADIRQRESRVRYVPLADMSLRTRVALGRTDHIEADLPSASILC